MLEGGPQKLDAAEVVIVVGLGVIDRHIVVVTTGHQLVPLGLLRRRRGRFRRVAQPVTSLRREIRFEYLEQVGVGLGLGAGPHELGERAHGVAGARGVVAGGRRQLAQAVEEDQRPVDVAALRREG